MPKYAITLEDGRVIEAYGPDEKAAKAHAGHAEATRIVAAQTKNRPNIVPFSAAAEIVKLKD